MTKASRVAIKQAQTIAQLSEQIAAMQAQLDRIEESLNRPTVVNKVKNPEGGDQEPEQVAND